MEKDLIYFVQFQYSAENKVDEQEEIEKFFFIKKSELAWERKKKVISYSSETSLDFSIPKVTKTRSRIFCLNLLDGGLVLASKLL